MIFMNFVCTFSFTSTFLAVFITHNTSISLSLINDNLLYIKFLDLLLFNSDYNKYLMWKWKIFDKLLVEDQKYVKIEIQADYFWQHYINNHLNNNIAVKVFLWLNLNSNASMEEFWVFINLQFKNNQLTEQIFNKLSSLKQKEKAQIYVQKFNQLIIKVNLISLSISEISDIHFGTKQMLFNRGLKNEIWIYVLLISRSTLFNEYIKQMQQADNELYQ